MKFTSSALLAVVSAFTVEQEAAFMRFVIDHNKIYTGREEFFSRLANYVRADNAISAINTAGGTSFAGHNFLSDWTEDEFNKLLGFKEQNIIQNEMTFELSEANVPESVDWRTKGAVTPIKDQGHCGSCWAFSSTGALEGAHFLASGTLLSLSEQQLVDCAGIKYGDMGCNGGRQGNAFRYSESHMLETEANYPYTSGSGKGGKCTAVESKEVVGAVSFTHVPKKSVDQLKAAIALQPVSVTIQANKDVFHYYTSGIITSGCGGYHLDHAVLAVGYGKDETSGQEYYIVKNSWGTSWGEQGYVRLGVEEGAGVCGIQKEALYP